MPKTLATWFCLLVLLLFSSLSAEEPQPPRIAVLSSDKSVWGDLLMTRLSKDPAVSLVERDDLGKALDEVELKELLGDRKKRSRFGEIAGADFLVLLNVTDNRARLVVCDTKLGVTLQDQNFSIAEQTQEKLLEALADTALQTIHSLAGGVKQLVAVSDFLCRDLTFDFTYLQSDYAKLLQSAYRQIPGTAIVAIEEAKAIAVERDIAGLAQKNRIVSVFMEGEYRTTRDLQSGGVSVEITLRARDSAKVLLERKLPSVPMSLAGKEMMSVFTKHLAALTQTENTNIDESAQYRMLIERADEFSMIGEFLRSTELREAALLLKPDDSEQRIKLIEEYIRHNKTPFESSSWPKGAKFDESNPLWLAAYTRAVTDWSRSLQHYEYLILNRWLHQRKAADITEEIIGSIWGIKHKSNRARVQLDGCEKLKKDFMRHVGWRIAYLDRDETDFNTGYNINRIFYFATVRVDKYEHGLWEIEDLNLLSNLLVNQLPDSMLPGTSIKEFMRDSAKLASREVKAKAAHYTKADYHSFLESLLASNRPLVRLYGRYGKYHLRQTTGETTPDLLEEFQGIVEEAIALGYDKSECDWFTKTFMEQLRGELKRASDDSIKEFINAVPPPPVPRRSSMLEPYSNMLVTLERIDMRLANTKDKGKILAPDTKSYAPYEWTTSDSYRSLTNGLDVIWRRGEIYFMSRPGELTQVLADAKLKVADVIYDGRYVWVAAADDWGLSVLDRDGRELTRVEQKDGLPPGGPDGLVVHSIEPGRVLVAGSFGNEKRGWIAIVRFEDGKSKVQIIHEATRVYKNTDRTAGMDPAMVFVPQSVIKHVIPGRKPREIFFVLRKNWQPLVVDLESLKVQVYPEISWLPQRFFHRLEANTFFSHQGILWVAVGDDDFSSCRFNEKSGLFNMIRHWRRGPSLGCIRAGSLTRVGEWLYYAGELKWRRINLQTGVEELILNANTLPERLFGGKWRFYNSSHYGLIAFYENSDSRLYRVKISLGESPEVEIIPSESTIADIISSESAKNKYIKNPLHLATYAFFSSFLGLIFIANLYRRRKRAIPTGDAG